MPKYTVKMECWNCNKEIDVDLSIAQEKTQHANNREVFCSKKCEIEYYKKLEQ